MEYAQYNDLERGILDQVALVGVMVEEEDQNMTSMILGALYQKLESKKDSMRVEIYEIGKLCYDKTIRKIYDEN
jgi:hypothetical protein